MNVVSTGAGERTGGKLEPEAYPGFSVQGRRRVLVVPHHSDLNHGPPPSAVSDFSGGKRQEKKARMLSRRMDRKAGEIFQSIFNCLDVGREERQ